MNSTLPPCPGPPEWLLPWQELDRAYPFIQSLSGCPQDPLHHGEGDVWVHTRMVCESLLCMPAFRVLPAEERGIVFAAALLHDVAKPVCTCLADGRIRAPGHSRRGAIMARTILWRLGVPPLVREQICAMIRHHQVPFYLVEEPDSQRRALLISQSARCDHLSLLAEADARGRICQDPERLLTSVALFAEYCREQGCLHGPFRFPSDHSRFQYFRTEGRDPHYLAHDDTRCDVTLMSGLPGSGKSTYIRQHLSGLLQISLDDLRAEMDIDPGEGQGAVIDRARQLCREALRQGTSFVWNATSLSHKQRAQCIDLFASYRARVRIVYVEVPEQQLLHRNRERAARVPQAAIARMLDRWEMPDRSEAHEVIVHC